MQGLLPGITRFLGGWNNFDDWFVRKNYYEQKFWFLPRSQPSQGLTGRTAIPGRCSLRPAPALRRSGTPLRRYAGCHQAYSPWQVHSQAACITAPLRTYAPPRLRRPQTAPTRPGVPAPFSLSLRSYFLISINTPSPANQVKPVASVGCENLGWVVCNWKW